MINTNSKTINLISMTHLYKKINIQNTYLNTLILKKFYQLGIVSSYKKNIKNRGCATVFYQNHSNIKIKNLYRKNSKIYISTAQLLKKKLNLFSTIYLISTPLGILTQYEAINKKTGGFFICKIFLY